MRNLGVLLLSIVALAADTGTIEGRLLNGDGTPWEGAQVTAYKLGEKTPWKRVTETDKEGRFRLVGLPPGRYVLRHGPKPKPRPKDSPLDELFKGMFEDLVHIPVDEDDPGAIVVEAGKTVRKEIRLPKQAPVQFVVTHRGKPLAGAEVEVFSVNADNKPGWTVSVGKRRSPRTGRDGVASLGEIDEGRYAVEFKVGQWSVYSGVHVVNGSEPHSFPVVLGEYSVRVRVLDANGKPVEKAEISISRGEVAWDFVRSRDMKKLSSRDGVYQVPYIRAGKVRVWVNGPGDSFGSCERIEVGPRSQEPEAIVRLDATATLVIRVVDAKGRPAPGIHVRVENADEEKGRPGFGYDVNARGEHRQVVTLRRWRVRIEDSDRGDGEWTIVKPEANEERIVVLTLPESR